MNVNNRDNDISHSFDDFSNTVFTHSQQSPFSRPLHYPCKQTDKCENPVKESTFFHIYVYIIVLIMFGMLSSSIYNTYIFTK